MDEEKGRNGIFYTDDGKMEVWWNGKNYGCALPEEMIDEVLDSSKNCTHKQGGNKTW
jgi:hypothetical protein